MDVENIQKGVKKINLNNKQASKIPTTVFYNKTFGNGGSSNEAVTTKSPRKRRRHRLKKDFKKIDNKSQHLSFNIEAIVNHQKCSFIKSRNDKNKYVNIYSYLNNDRKTIIFLNQLCNHFNEKTLPTDIEKLENGIQTTKKRKYLNIHLQYQNSSNKKNRLRARKKRYEPYLSSNDLTEALAKNQLIEGVIRINIKNFKEAYVTNIDENDGDYLISSIEDRNRALEGDVVYLKLKQKEEWKGNLKTASVAYIKEKVHSRTTIGYLSPIANGQSGILVPRDIRVPRLKIPKTNFPAQYRDNKTLYEKVLFHAKIIEWRDPKYAKGFILDQLGTDSNLEVQNNALLLEQQIAVTEIPESALQDIKFEEPIPESEILTREDIRKDCVFTIDPMTAKDLDDALSLKELPNGNIEIGVHIADVTYYLSEETILDKLVSERATSIYLVNKVYHMLPTALCLKCSLLPDKDCLSFSVFWEFNTNGEIIRHRFARTIMRSCAQLAYEHAQAMIEEPDKVFTKDELPTIGNGYDSKTISNVVNTLQKIAVRLRTKRFVNGALRIDQPKLAFKLSPIEQIPIDIFIYEIKDAHRLIEEFMLLANQTVAQKILDDFPDLAFLRNHKSPFQRALTEAQKTLEKYEIDLNIDSGADIQASLWKIETNSSNGRARLAVLNYLLTKAMKRAMYICAGTCNDYSHYALSVPTYTHFTSPIRRYPDIMVHRLLAASLGYRSKPDWTKNYVEKIAQNCNTQKNLSKKAQEASNDLYLAFYIEKNQPFIRQAVVADVKDRSFEVIVFETGNTIRMPFNNLGENITCEVVNLDEKKFKVHVTFEAEKDLPKLTQPIKLFEIVYVSLTRRSKSTKLCAELVRPQ